MFIEVKAPDKFDSDIEFVEGQLFNLALLESKNGPVQYLGYHSVDGTTGDLTDRLVIVDFTKYRTFENWQDAGSISLDTLPADYGLARKRRYVNVPPQDELPSFAQRLDTSTSRATFFSLRRQLHNVLWGGGSMSYNDIFSNLVKLLLAKIYDEETTPVGTAFSFQVEFIDGEPEDGAILFARVDALFRSCQRDYLAYSEEELKNSVGIDRDKIALSKVVYVVEKLQGISLRENQFSDLDLLGEFFEGIVGDGFKQDKGQFFTHQNIVKFIFEVLELRALSRALVSGKENPAKPRLPFVCDPSCGSGTFLIGALKQISQDLKEYGKTGPKNYKTREFLASNAPQLTPNIWAREFVYGNEPQPDLAMATKVNMVLHGDGNINVVKASGVLPFQRYLSSQKISALSLETPVEIGELRGVFNSAKNYPMNAQFDVVVTNPPFAVELDRESIKQLEKALFFFRSFPKSEVLFIERWFQLLKEGGRLAAVLPDSVFDNTDMIAVRIFLYRFFHLRAIVSLPMTAFQPYTPTKTSVLFAQKKRAEEVAEFDAAWNEAFEEASAHAKHVRTNGRASAKESLAYVLAGQINPSELEEFSEKQFWELYSTLIEEAISQVPWLTYTRVIEKVGAEAFPVAHAEHIGFKRSKKYGEIPQRNQLFVDPAGRPTEPVADGHASILDFLRANVSWC